jgi:hypothetical protein
LEIAKVISASERKLDAGVTGRRPFFERFFFPSGLKSGPVAAQDSYISRRFVDPDANYSSCSWIFSTEIFQTYCTNAGPYVLWVKGAQGCGKSVLAASIVEKLQNSRTGNGTVPFILYHYCDERYKTTSDDLARSLIAQTAAWENENVFGAMQEFKARQTPIQEGDLSARPEVWKLFTKIMSVMASSKVYIVIDGIEHCESSSFPIVSLSKSIVHPGLSVQPSLMFITRNDANSAYPIPIIAAFHAEEPRFQISQLEITPARVQGDIEAYVNHHINSEMSPLASKPPEDRQNIADEISRRADGMFLYASMAVEALKEDRVASDGAIATTLASLPSGLHQIYEQSLQRVKNSLKGSTIISWVYAAFRELSWPELQHALTIVDGKYDPNEIITGSFADFIRLSCGPLIDIVGDNGTQLRFIHPSVTRFLTDPAGPGPSIGIPMAHSTVVKALLTIIMHPDVPDFSAVRYDDPVQKLATYAEAQGRELFRYALSNWHKHLMAAGKENDVELEVELGQLLSAPASLRWIVSTMLLRGAKEKLSSSSFALEIVSSLETWAKDRQFSILSLPSDIELWTQDFLVLMLDWGHVIEKSPCDIFFLHYDLLPAENRFRRFLDGGGARSIVQFTPLPIETSGSQKPTWVQHVFATDLERGLAFALEGGFLLCYHVSTGLLVSEMGLGEGQEKDLMGVRLDVTRSVLSPDGKFLALLVEAVQVQGKDGTPAEILRKIQSGLQLRRTIGDAGSKNPIGWRLENEKDDDETHKLAEFFDVPIVAASIWMLQLNYDATTRNDLLSFPGWATLPLVGAYIKTPRWKIDDGDIMGFSADSKYFRANPGTLDLSQGTWEQTAMEMSDNATRGSSISADFQHIVSVKNRSTLEVANAENGTVIETVPFQGIGHILAVSNHARFILVLRVRSYEMDDGKPELPFPPQRGTIAVYDRTLGAWSELLQLQPPLSKKHEPWRFQDLKTHSVFAPEETRSRVLVAVPPGWQPDGNLRWDAMLESVSEMKARPHVLIFDNTRYEDGFGSRPVLRFLMPAESE